MVDDQQRIAELQAEVIGMRRVLPKTYRKLMKIEYKHFLNNMKHGECTIPVELLDVPITTAETLDKHLQEIAELQQTTSTSDGGAAGELRRTEPVEQSVQRKSRQLQTARRVISRMRRKPVYAAMPVITATHSAAGTMAAASEELTQP